MGTLCLAIGRLIAFAVAGHHAGLADGAGASGSLEARPARAGDLPDYRGWSALVPDLPGDIAPSLAGGLGDPGYTLAFLGRMLFSCLVDADFLETERFYAEAEGKPPERGPHEALAVLRERLDRYLGDLAARAAPTSLNAHRAEILRHARAKAALPPGLFTMTVPTGGGKTLAGLAVALDHAITHGLERVVYVIPYTSIIEQTVGISARRCRTSRVRRRTCSSITAMSSGTKRRRRSSATRSPNCGAGRRIGTCLWWSPPPSSSSKASMRTAPRAVASCTIWRQA